MKIGSYLKIYCGRVGKRLNAEWKLGNKIINLIDACRWQIITSGGRVASGYQRSSLRKENPEFKLPGGGGRKWLLADY